MKIYCSGPLFTDAERDEMSALAAAIEKAGFETFLPHRDGVEFLPLAQILVMQGVEDEKAQSLWDRAIFALDVFQILVNCDGMVVNLNGRVPDEGAVSEAAMAWAAGKKIVAYKNDVRSLYFGKDNPLLTGLFGFQTCAGASSVIEALKKSDGAQKAVPYNPPPSVKSALALGEAIWKIKSETGDMMEIAKVLLEFDEKV